MDKWNEKMYEADIWNNVIIIPAYRPSDSFITLMNEWKNRNCKVIVVDDGSGSDYAHIFQEFPLVLTREVNQGKGCAIKTALQYIKEHTVKQAHDQKRSCDSTDGIPCCIVTMDCDGQHTVKDALHLLEEAKNNPGSLILGTRDFRGRIPWKSKLGNILTRILFRITQRISLQDTQTGLRAFTSDMIEDFLQVSGERYEYEMNILSYCVKNKIPIREIPIETIYHDEKNSETHFRAVKDSILVYQDVIKFTLSSMSSFLVDYILFAVFIIVLKKLPEYILISNILARIISAAYNYLVNAKLVFRMEKATAKSALQYFLLALFILCMNNVILSAVLYVTGFSPMIAKIITELLLFIMSFIIQHLIIFKKRER